MSNERHYKDQDDFVRQVMEELKRLQEKDGLSGYQKLELALKNLVKAVNAIYSDKDCKDCLTMGKQQKLVKNLEEALEQATPQPILTPQDGQG